MAHKVFAGSGGGYHQYVEDMGELLNMDVTNFPIITLCMSTYGQVMSDTRKYLPAELAISVFDVCGKVNEFYTTLIDPGVIPSGQTYLIKDAKRIQGLEEPGFDVEKQNYRLIIDTALEIIKKFSPKDGNQPVFCFIDNFSMVYGCLDWMYEKAGLSPKRNGQKEFRLWPLETLLHKLTMLGFALRSAEEGMKPLDEPEEAKRIRDDMRRRFGVGAMLAPLATTSGANVFPTNFEPENQSEEILIRTGKICNEGHAREFLQETVPVKWWDFACPLHYEAAIEDDCRIFSHCAAMNAHIVRERFRLALSGYFAAED